MLVTGFVRKENPVEVKLVGSNSTPLAEFGLCYEKGKWLNCKAWREQALSLSGVKGGESLFVAGHMETREWTGSDGQPKSRTELVADFVTLPFMGAAKPLPQSFTAATKPVDVTPPGFNELEDDGELPF